jgi:predicted Zn-dependent peptidase
MEVKYLKSYLLVYLKKHNYGLQTTIGTVEHLKNPLVEIRNYFNKYYVPNNMGIIMSGDFNADEVIAKIDKTFGQMQTRPFQKYKFENETPHHSTYHQRNRWTRC